MTNLKSRMIGATLGAVLAMGIGSAGLAFAQTSDSTTTTSDPAATAPAAPAAPAMPDGHHPGDGNCPNMGGASGSGSGSGTTPAPASSSNL